MSGVLTIRQFFKRFPTDESCLERIMEKRFGLRHTCGHCGIFDSSFHKITGEPAYACAHCGWHLHPLAGTIFQDTRTSLQLWFYAIYLFVATRHGVSAKELQRQLGVTYKTAWRMGQQIRLLMSKADTKGLLNGHVEIDETYVGGKRPGKRGRGAAGKTIVMGLQERQGRLVTEVIPDVTTKTLREKVHHNVAAGAVVSTDELASYNLLEKDGYRHGQVNHSQELWSYYDYRTGETHHTNSVEGFWHLFKASVRGTHIHVSKKHMNKYLGEFTFRANYRDLENGMFDVLLSAV